MQTINEVEILNEIYEIAKTSKDEQVKLQAFSIILCESKGLKYQDVMQETLNKMINSSKRL